MNDLLRLDLGCGPSKKEGTLGVDMVAAPCVDHVVDFDREPLPFADDSVGYVFSSHCLEHVENPVRLLKEISRVAAHEAEVEIWVPYAWNNDACLYGHRTFFNETHFDHLRIFPEVWNKEFGATWHVHEIVFSIRGEVLDDLRAHGVELGFAMRYYTNVVTEMGVMARILKRDVNGAPPAPRRTYAFGRAPEGRRDVAELGKGFGKRLRRAFSALTGRRL